MTLHKEQRSTPCINLFWNIKPFYFIQSGGNTCGRDNSFGPPTKSKGYNPRVFITVLQVKPFLVPAREISQTKTLLQCSCKHVTEMTTARHLPAWESSHTNSCNRLETTPFKHTHTTRCLLQSIEIMSWYNFYGYTNEICQHFVPLLHFSQKYCAQPIFE